MIYYIIFQCYKIKKQKKDTNKEDVSSCGKSISVNMRRKKGVQKIFEWKRAGKIKLDQRKFDDIKSDRIKFDDMN